MNAKPDKPKVAPWIKAAAKACTDKKYNSWFREENRKEAVICDRIFETAIAAHAPEQDAHIPAYAHVIPTPERIAAAHTSMSRGSLTEVTAGRGHRIYTQGIEEGCYICALLVEIDTLRAEQEPSVPVSKLKAILMPNFNCEALRECIDDLIHSAEKEQK